MSNSYYSIVRFAKDKSIENYAQPGATSSFTFELLKHGSIMMDTYPINCSESGYLMINTLRGVASDSTTDLIVYGIYLSNDFK